MSIENIDFEKKLEEYFCFDNQTFYNIYLCDTSLSNRAKNCLKKVNCNTIGELLRLSMGYISNIPASGKGTLICIYSFLEELKSKDVNTSLKTVFEKSSYQEIKPFSGNILKRDFSFISTENFCEETIFNIEFLKNEPNIFASNLLQNYQKYKYSLKTIYSILYRIHSTLILIEKEIKKIPLYRQAMVAQKYLNLYYKCHNNFPFESKSNVQSISEFIWEHMNIKGFNQLKPFVELCSISLETCIEELNKLLNLKPRIYDILYLRAKGFTLEEIGDRFSITRERIRQLEKRGCEIIQKWDRRNTFIGLFVNDYIDTTVIKKDYFICYKELGEIIFFSLKKNRSLLYTYNEEYDVYLYGDDMTLDGEINYVSSLPDMFSKNELDIFCERGILLDGISKDRLKIVLDSEFKLTGQIYHRKHLSNGSVCLYVISKYYPNGIQVYDQDELNSFKKYVVREFGDIVETWTQRSIIGNITRVCILTNRGVYSAPKDSYIDLPLRLRIENFIESSERNVFFIRSIFEEFKEDLLDEGIDNHYYLQGILREIYGDKYYFSKDYISKDPNSSNIHDEIVNYIKKFDYPVSINALKTTFLGVTDIVITMALSDNDILNYFGQYIHFSKLRFIPNQKNYFKNEIDSLLNDNCVHNIKELYNFIHSNNPQMLSRIYIRSEFALFSVIFRLFANEYQFSRPYFALKGVNFIKPGDQIREYVKTKSTVDIDELLDICDELSYRIPTNIITFLNSFNDTHLVVNKYELKLINDIGISENIAIEVERIISNEVLNTKPISDLLCVSRFPKVNIPWTEQLIYSVIYKWGRYLEVNASFNISYKKAILLIAPAGKLDNYIFEKMGELAIVDDLDKIDDLIEDELINHIEF